VRPRARIAAAALAAGLALPAAAVGSVGVFLPAPTAQLTTEPPLLARTLAPERQFPGRLASRLRVTVDLGPDGRPTAVSAEQRLIISALGDYFFVVPAPLVSVSRAPGTAAAPGQRRQGVVWQGFSAGRKVLGARVRLRTGAAAPLLPLRVRIVPGGVRISNATGVPALGYDAELPTGVIGPIVERLRRAFARGELPAPASVQVPGTPRSVQIRAEALFAVRGRLVFHDGSVRFAGRIGPGASRTLTVRTKTRERPKVELVATPALPLELVSSRRLLPTGATLLRLATEAYYAVARGQQYARFLANPDPAGPATAAFVYRTAATAAPAAATHRPGDGGTSPVTIVLVAAGSVLLLGGLVVVWAHL
jgi:hypothetical protein